MNYQQIMHTVEYGLEQFSTETENQIKYLTAVLYFLEFDMNTIELFDGMSLDEHLRYYELKEAITDIQYRIATLKVRKPAARFQKIDESETGLER